MLLRILTVILLAISVLFFPFWLTFIIGFASIIYFPFFLEAVFLLLLSDLLHASFEGRFLGVPYISFLITLLFLIITELLKKKVRFLS